jgi:hypothetical protein
LERAPLPVYDPVRRAPRAPAFVLALRVSRNSSTEINRSFRRDDR